MKSYSTTRLILAAIAIFLFSLGLCLHGIQWERYHPDEIVIAKWLDETKNPEHPYISTRVYPSGFFEIARIFRWFEKQSDHLRERYDRWISEGEANYNQYHSSTKSYEMENTIFRGRRWCAILMALSTVFLFLIALRITTSFPASVAASVLFASHPFIVEYAHYCETDASMMAAGLLAFWILVESVLENGNGDEASSIRKSQWFIVVPLLAAFATGFALSCKYTLIPMAILPPIAAWMFSSARGWKIKFRICIVVAAILLVIVGALLGTPFLVHEPSNFMARYHETSAFTYGETATNLGKMANNPYGRILLKTRSILDQIVKLGAAWWIWFAIAVPAWGITRLRRQLAVLPFFAVLFPILVIFGFPWFRNQEFLPLLPFLCVTAVLPCVTLRSRALRAVAWVVVAGFVVAGIMDGMKMSSYFSMVETRHNARMWIKQRLPKDVFLGTETYADGVTHSMWKWNCQHIQNIDIMDESAWADIPAHCYIVRTPSMPARGTRHPWTKKRFPSSQIRYDTFTNSASLLCSWSMPWKLRPTFSQPDLELWACCGGNAPELDLPIYLQRPDNELVSWEDMFCLPGSVDFGPRDVVRLLKTRSRIILPDSKGKPYYAVAFAAPDSPPAEIVWNSSFKPHSATIQPGGAILFRAKSPLLLASACKRTAARLRKTNGTEMVWIAITTDPGLAAHWLREAGDAKTAYELLASFDDLDDAAKYEGALAAESAGINPPDEWKLTALNVREKIKAAHELLKNGAPLSSISIRGVPLSVYEDFQPHSSDTF